MTRPAAPRPAAAAGAVISYRVDIEDANAHLFRVTLTVPRPGAEQRLSLPVWIPGSYLVREFARHVSALQARQGETPVPLEQLDKTTWLARCTGSRPLVVTLLAYAFDNSVRTAWLDARRGFFNGTSLCLRVEGREREAHDLSLGTLPRGWQVATAMPPAPSGRPRQFRCASYDELIDHPVEMGDFWRGAFEVAGVEHEFVVAGAWPQFDGERLLADTKKIVQAEIGFWHGKGSPPFERYVFMLNAVDDGYGGLEHRASTALIAARRDLPRIGQPGLTDGYVTLLGLISHEYFHSWNVKRLKPAELAPPDLSRENHTPLLWFFEGFTSYYDDLFLVRAGLIDEARYLKLVAKTASGVWATPGRKVQSVAQSSFDAWTKYYRPDENTSNATVSYYTKGSLVALALDLALRGAGRGSLDEVMRLLWQRSGATRAHEDPRAGAIREADIEQALREVAGRSLRKELQAWVHGTEDLPLPALLQRAGIEWKREPATLSTGLGLRLAEGALTGVQVRGVARGSAAERAGLSAGDELLAVDGWRVRRLDDAQQWLVAGQPFDALVSRDQRLLTLRVQPESAPQGGVSLVVAAASAGPASKAAAALRRSWLAG